MSELLKAAIDCAGGPAKVADELGIGRISVYEWIRKDRLPADRIIPICRMGKWVYTPHQLDPALYPNAGDGIITEPTPTPSTEQVGA